MQIDEDNLLEVKVDMQIDEDNLFEDNTEVNKETKAKEELFEDTPVYDEKRAHKLIAIKKEKCEAQEDADEYTKNFIAQRLAEAIEDKRKEVGELSEAEIMANYHKFWRGYKKPNRRKPSERIAKRKMNLGKNGEGSSGNPLVL